MIEYARPSMKPTVSLAFGVLSVLMSWIPLVSAPAVIFALVGLTVGGSAMRAQAGRADAMAGVVLSSLGLVIGGAITAGSVLALVLTSV